jgi:hypothetical protein
MLLAFKDFISELLLLLVNKDVRCALFNLLIAVIITSDSDQHLPFKMSVLKELL